MAPSPGFDFTGLVVWSLLAPRSWEPPSQSSPFCRSVTFWRLCGASWSTPPCFLTQCGAPWLMALRSGHCRLPAGIASMDGPLLVSSVESKFCECPFVVLLRQLVGSGVCSPASPICPTSSVLKLSSFGISASVFASSLRDGVTLSGRVLSQISIGTKTLCAPSLVVGAKPSRWGHPFRVVWHFSVLSIGTKASSIHLFFVASRWGHPAGLVCFSHTRS